MNNEVKGKVTTMFIAENLKRLRLLYNLKPIEVAKIIKKSRQGYMNYETGVREISINSLIALSVYYNVSIDEIVGNPYSLRTSKKLSFTAFIYNNGILTETIPRAISTANNDVIVVTHDDLNIEFFWKTQTNSVNHDMLFLYYDIPYISKVFFDQQGGGFFFINGEMVYFEKDKAEEIIFLGVSMGKLKKDFTIPYFF